MIRSLIATLLLATVPILTQAQTTKPRQTPPATADTIQGEYVAPGMTGAPKQRVTTDYNNNPLPGTTHTTPAATTLSDKKSSRAAKSRP